MYERVGVCVVHVCVFQLVQFSQLNYLDLSDNEGLKIREEDADKLK